MSGHAQGLLLLCREIAQMQSRMNIPRTSCNTPRGLDKMVPAVLLAGIALPVYTNTAWIQQRSMSRPLRLFSIVRSQMRTALQV